MVPGQGYFAPLETVMGEYEATVELGRQKCNMKHKSTNPRPLRSKKSGSSILRCDAIYLQM